MEIIPSAILGAIASIIPYLEHNQSPRNQYEAAMAKQSLGLPQSNFLYKLDSRGHMDSVYLPKEAYDELDKLIESGLKKADELIQEFKSGRLEAMPGFTVEETFENKITEVLSRVREDAATVVEKYIRKNSEGYLMAKTGARGSIVNIVQMVATLGQQTIRGERIRRGYRTRTLPHFPVGDIGAYVGGFVKSCFRCGLSPVEYFFHAAAGRDGLIDTAVRTAQSGYMLKGDPRRTEPKKPGIKHARSKRQKAYR